MSNRKELLSQLPKVTAKAVDEVMAKVAALTNRIETLTAGYATLDEINKVQLQELREKRYQILKVLDEE